MRPMLFDIVAPTVICVVLHRLGVATFLALTMGGFATGVNTVVGTVRRRRLDGVGLLVVVEIVLSIAPLFVTNDPRIVLIKPSFYAAVAAICIFATCFVGHPVSYGTSRQIAASRGPARLAAFELAWDQVPEFRREQRIITAAWGVAFLADAVLRFVVVFRFSSEQINQSVLLSQVPGIAAIVAALVFSRRRVPRIRRRIDAEEQAAGGRGQTAGVGSPAA